MNNEELKDQILKVLDESRVGTMATVTNGKPHSRYMTYFHEGLNLFTATHKETHKVEEIEKNPNVHILLGYEGEGFGDDYLEIEGTISVNDSKEMKEKLWNPYLEKWFDGPNDPNYSVLEIKPTTFRLMNSDYPSPQTLEL
ncbi:MAG TPA: pyridoxamine 5'-phosphate oxidase family protein [Chondromyces sp.]|nr:pyridoxamine 5'-phosphate oxidase family protein [Chondromyces sp.]